VHASATRIVGLVRHDEIRAARAALEQSGQ
jgi:hypothetical protein